MSVNKTTNPQKLPAAQKAVFVTALASANTRLTEATSVSDAVVSTQTGTSKVSQQVALKLARLHDFANRANARNTYFHGVYS